MSLRVSAAAPEFVPALTLAPGDDPVWRARSPAGPVEPSGMLPAPLKSVVIKDLRSRILSLERHAPRRGPSALAEVSPPEGADGARAPQPGRWELGCPASDALLPRGLETNSIHEVKGTASPRGGASAADWMAAIGFAARLAVRRTEALSALRTKSAASWVLWCWPRALAGEFGSPSAAGLAHLGLDPSRLIIVETARAGEALNAIEESLKAHSLAVVIGVLEEIELTPARRLSLAAGETATPCLLITHPASAPAGATATRWRVGRVSSGDHPFDPRAPGYSRFSAVLERCRARPGSAARSPLLLEWSDETRRFGLASVVADIPAQTHGAKSNSSAPTVRAR